MKLNVLVAGEAGQGIDKFADLLCKLIVARGLYVFNYRDYQSLITGGVNFNIISVSKEKVYCYEKPYDIAIFFHKKVIKQFLPDIKKKGIIICDSAFVDEIEGNFKVIEIDSEKIIKKHNLSKIVKNTLFLGTLVKLLGFPKQSFEIIKDEFKKAIKDNAIAFEQGYSINKIKIKLPKSKKRIVYFKGNEAIAKALMFSGLDIYYAYPMTPSTGVLHALAKSKVFTFQLENEIAIINAALGSSFAGKKVAIGTSGGGFALMNEALSLAGMAELPLVIYVAMRYGPSTGAPTYSSQGDLKYVVNAGHGEFAKVVLSFDANNLFRQVIDAVKIAYKYRIPVIMLNDKLIAESGFSFNASEIEKIESYARRWREKYEKQRKKLIAKLKQEELIKNYPLNKPFYNLPELGKHIFKVTGYEHDEFGFTVEAREKLEIMGKRRKERIEEIKKLVNSKDAYAVYGNKNAKNLLIAYGSLVNSLIEFIKRNKNFKLLAINYLKPFPNIGKEIKKAKKVFVLEDSLTCQLADLIAENTGIIIKNRITRHNGRPWLVKEIEEMLKVKKKRKK